MDATVTVTDADPGALSSLRDELQRQPELYGRILLTPAAPQPGTIGVLTDALTVAREPSGAAAAFAAVFVTWLRRRKSSARFKVTRADGSVLEFSAERMSGLHADAIRT